jgi:CRP-like cAMP-binding protein
MSEETGTAAEARRLLQETKLFACLSESVRLRPASYAQERFFVPGELLLREGDPAEEFFLIASGSVHVIGRAFDGTNLVMARLTRGQVFGEQALLQGGSQIRNASVRAAERCRLLVYPGEPLTEVQEVDESLTVKLGAIGERQAAERRELLREKVLQDIGLGAHYEIKRFEKDQIIFREGDPAGDVYLILDGTARNAR